MSHILMTSLLLLILNDYPPFTSDQSEEEAIVETLQLETRYFCERNLEKWQEQWVHKPYTSKMYAGNTEFREFIGWEAVNQNTLDHIKAQPEKIPIPVSNQDYNIELLGKTALVFYSNNNAAGTVREIRLMVKEEDKWKIARMQTIY
ncbi:hypothetical protein WJR50_33945 [Catalinimonas sp. 4WD22]|uniref:hypothetical protein n=1 Tax=Catalinimonas locisalis TaxID=3133978 RepID=UPI003100DFDD